jgi:serine/threonine protein phosphatase PrpC
MDSIKNFFKSPSNNNDKKTEDAPEVALPKIQQRPVEFLQRTVQSTIRKVPEDTSAQDGELFAVFDGHKSPKVALFLAATLLPILKVNYRTVESVEKAFSKVDSIIANGDKDLYVSGSTAVVAAFCEGDQVVLINLGDSRAMVFSSTGELIVTTVDHHPRLPGEERRIQSLGGQVLGEGKECRVNGYVGTSRAFGDFVEPYPGHPCKTLAKSESFAGSKEQVVSPIPAISKHSVKPGDYVLLCSDGCLENVLIEDISKIIATQSLSFANKFDQIFSLSDKSKDDRTLMLIRLQ